LRGHCWKLVGLEISNANGTLASEAKGNSKIAILLIEPKNIIIKVKNPYCIDMNVSAVMKGVDNVVLLMPLTGDLRVQDVKGRFCGFEHPVIMAATVLPTYCYAFKLVRVYLQHHVVVGRATHRKVNSP
jgi:hypothetical protein